MVGIMMKERTREAQVNIYNKLIGAHQGSEALGIRIRQPEMAMTLSFELLFFSFLPQESRQKNEKRFTGNGRSPVPVSNILSKKSQ